MSIYPDPGTFVETALEACRGEKSDLLYVSELDYGNREIMRAQLVQLSQARANYVVLRCPTRRNALLLAELCADMDERFHADVHYLDEASGVALAAQWRWGSVTQVTNLSVDIDAKRHPHYRETLGGSTFRFCGRADPDKRLLEILRGWQVAFPYLPIGSSLNVHAAPYDAAYEHDCRDTALRIPGVRWLGAYDWFRGEHALPTTFHVAASSDEGFSRGLAEAVLDGCVVVSPDLPGTGPLTRGSAVEIASPVLASTIAEALVQCAQLDSATRLAIAQRQYNYVRSVSERLPSDILAALGLLRGSVSQCPG